VLPPPRAPQCQVYDTCAYAGIMGPGGARAVSHSGGPAQALACEAAWVCRGADAACLSSCMLLSRLSAMGEGLYGGQGGRQAPPPSQARGCAPASMTITYFCRSVSHSRFHARCSSRMYWRS